MGGHGGLNILPQKRWNVYGRENRLKVKRDEQKAEAEQAEKDALHQKAESEYRHNLLLKRAAHRFGTTESSGEPLPSEARGGQDASEAPRILLAEGGGGLAGELVPAAAQAGAARDNGGAFDFLGFLQTQDPKGQHPEVAEEQRKAAARRGEEKTQTSDAKFDAQFAFGHGLAGAANQPWYAKPVPEEAAVPEEQGPQLTLPPVQANPAASKPKKHKDKKEKRLHKEKKRKEQTRVKGGGVNKKDLFAGLRAEREAREAAERKRARQAVLDATAKGSGEPEGKRYHSAFGFQQPQAIPRPHRK